MNTDTVIVVSKCGGVLQSARTKLETALMNANMEIRNPEWIEITSDEIEMMKSQKAGVMPTPKVFTFKDDGNNADGHFAKLDRAGVLNGAQDSVSYLKEIGFVKS